MLAPSERTHHYLSKSIPFVLFLGLAVSLVGHSIWVRQIVFIYHAEQYTHGVLAVQTVKEVIGRDGRGAKDRSAVVCGTIGGKPVEINAHSLGHSFRSIDGVKRYYRGMREQSVMYSSSPVSIPLNSIDVTVVDAESYRDLSVLTVLLSVSLWNSIVILALTMLVYIRLVRKRWRKRRLLNDKGNGFTGGAVREAPCLES